MPRASPRLGRRKGPTVAINRPISRLLSEALDSESTVSLGLWFRCPFALTAFHYVYTATPFLEWTGVDNQGACNWAAGSCHQSMRIYVLQSFQEASGKLIWILFHGIIPLSDTA